jgi:hypothetical protein
VGLRSPADTSATTPRRLVRLSPSCVNAVLRRGRRQGRSVFLGGFS